MFGVGVTKAVPSPAISRAITRPQPRPAPVIRSTCSSIPASPHSRGPAFEGDQPGRAGSTGTLGRLDRTSRSKVGRAVLSTVQNLDHRYPSRDALCDQVFADLCHDFVEQRSLKSLQLLTRLSPTFASSTQPRIGSSGPQSFTTSLRTSTGKPAAELSMIPGSVKRGFSTADCLPALIRMTTSKTLSPSSPCLVMNLFSES